ncbi:MAG: PIN domain-containing protein [Candidatus Nitricoxidivorans perseverans]|uniref:PIN domain-containing protein n=1 Tax=Candidatus Nitricoxidivorans perseverans TaxID=2975601 RepID=A0AA49FMI1_9PROT|nr:MAG: PIN domain-containing protein [Candidatus Nitricoxidivorans perseverans]
MRKIIADSGPLIALFDRSDRNRPAVKGFLRDYEGALVTTWPVLTEVGHMLGFSVDRQIDFLEWVRRGALDVADLPKGAVDAILKATRNYRNVPMDLADASLLVLAMETGVREILTFDADFDIYRLPDKSQLLNVLRT